MPTAAMTAELTLERQQAALEANFTEFLRLSLPRWPGCEAFIEPDLVQGVCPIPLPLFNPVAGARLKPAEADARIQTAIARAKAKGAPLLWWVGPTSEPANLGERLLQHGFTKMSEPPGMLLELSHLQAPTKTLPGLSIGEVLTPDQLTQWVEVCRAGFGMPEPFRAGALGWFGSIGMGPSSPFRHLLAYVGGKPVASATLVAGGEIAGIYNVSTLEGFRRKGIGAAITTACCELAIALGYRYVGLESSAMGVPVYQALGFVDRCKVTNYLYKPKER